MATQALRTSRRTVKAVEDATHILLKGLPLSMTSNDVRRALKSISGIDRVDVQYKHFRPTGKAIITMTLPDFTDSAVAACKRLPIRGYDIEAMPVADPDSLEPPNTNGTGFDRYTYALGDGPSAGVVPGKTVTLSGFNGRITTDAVRHLVSDFQLRKAKNIAPVQRVPLPDKKFSMFARFCIHLESDSEAQRLVRQLHMRPYRGVQGAPIIQAEVIY